jgi:hypothetical protein
MVAGPFLDADEVRRDIAVGSNSRAMRGEVGDLGATRWPSWPDTERDMVVGARLMSAPARPSMSIQI